MSARWMCAVVAATVLALTSPTVSAAADAGEGIPVRLRHLEGTVSVQRAMETKAEPALANLPLGPGDRLWTEESGRAELLFDDGSMAWVDERTTLDVVSVGPEGRDAAILRLWAGSLIIWRPSPTLRPGPSLRVDAPAGRVLLDGAGLFRVDVDDEQRLWLSVYDGRAELEAGGVQERVSAGRFSYAERDTAPSRSAAFNTAEADDFFAWQQERLAAISRTERYVAGRSYLPRRLVRHAVDLEPHGTWIFHSSLGTWGWRPYVPLGWVPFRHGRWVFTHLGWTWVPFEPWGWVTVHFGRWHFLAAHGWVWFPGVVWSPAWVHWFVSPHWIGWVPLNFFDHPAVILNLAIFSHGPGHGGRLEAGVLPRGGAGGRVVAGLGYTSGLSRAWTFVRASQLAAADVSRVAVRRLDPGALGDVGSRTTLSGPLRVRDPGRLLTGRRHGPRLAVPRSGDVPGSGPRLGGSGGAGSGRGAVVGRRVAVPRVRAAPGPGVPGGDRGLRLGGTRRARLVQRARLPERVPRPRSRPGIGTLPWSPRGRTGLALPPRSPLVPRVAVPRRASTLRLVPRGPASRLGSGHGVLGRPPGLGGAAIARHGIRLGRARPAPHLGATGSAVRRAYRR